MKCSLSWALLVLMFAVALVPANGLTVFHAHDDHDDHGEHNAGLLGLSEAYHVTGSHDAEGLHAHRLGWSQIQKSSVLREIGAPVLVTQIWLNALAQRMPVERFVSLAHPSAESEMVHAPPPLLRSMAFLI
ncbi:MAG: hypothetical protein Q8N18_26205 [Opitutaceae bacterium]|nr:hypothetical protein [Opitutaceae bacterium]